MAFKRKLDTGSGEGFKFETIGQKLTGFYLGTFPFDGSFGPTVKHLFKTTNGKIVSVIGQKHLSGLLESETAGPLMQITYTADKKGKKGNPMKMYTVDIDTDQTVPVDELPHSIEESSEPDYGDEPMDVADEEEAMDEVKTAPARSIAPKTNIANSEAAKARVAALLNNRKKLSA